MSEELTYPQEVIRDHIAMCDRILGAGHKEVPIPEGCPKVGELIVCNNTKPRAIIACVFGYIYTPFNGGSIRCCVGVGSDVMITDLNPVDKKQERAYNLFTKDFNPVERRMTCLL